VRAPTTHLIRATRPLACATSLLVLAAGSVFATPHAYGITLATEPDVGPVVLWKGGAAWWGAKGIEQATPGSSPSVLKSFPDIGSLTYNRGLDAGAGAGGNALAYGWFEVNSETPPMGPGDTNVPPPAIPYETAILHRGVISAGGTATAIPECEVNAAPEVPNQQVSLAGSSVVYGCAEPNGTPPGKVAPGYGAIAAVSAPGTVLSDFYNLNGTFQLTGNFVAYLAGEPSKSSRVIVRNVATNTVAYETPPAATLGAAGLASQEDGSVVLLGPGTSPCPAAHNTPTQTYPATWFPVGAPTAHQLGCFYDGSLRAVGGKWVALAPGPGSEASLVLVDLATGSRTTLAVFPDPGTVEPRQQPLFPAEDFDGKRLAWTLETCAGDTVQLTEDVSAMSPGPAPSNACPVQFHINGALHVGPHGKARLRVSCPLGCSDVDLSVRHPRALATESAGFFSLPPSSTARESFDLGPRKLAYLRRHRRVGITLRAEVARLGAAGFARYSVHATLVR
jgi:hypothetical protein